MLMNKKLALLLTPLLFLPKLVHAHCPLCTGAVVAGAVGAEYLGLDTAIVGIFAGAFAISTALWINKSIKRYFKLQTFILLVLSFALTVVPASWAVTSAYIPFSLFNHNYLVDHFMFGSIIGAILTVTGYYLHLYIKKINNGVLFPFQGIVLTLAILIIAAAIFQFTL